MRKWLSALLVVLAALPVAADVPQVKSATLAAAFDLDGEAADADQVVTSVALTDSATFTVAANPDACRLVDITVTDADSSISAGVLTVVGTDCWGYPMTATFTFAAGGSGVKTLVLAATGGSPVKASGAYFATVTSASTGVLTGEGGGDTVTIGYTANSAKSWAMYGVEARSPGTGRRFVDVFGKIDVNCLVKNGAATTDVTAVTAASTACFENVAVGDVLLFNVSGDVVARRVATRADADTITINSGLTLPAAGLNFSYRERFFLADPIDGWISVQGYRRASFAVEVDVNANTGGVVTSIECASAMSGDLPTDEIVVEVDTDTVASGAAGSALTSIVLDELPHFTHCRAGLKFGTGDDADAAAEDIDVSFALVR